MYQHTLYKLFRTIRIHALFLSLSPSLLRYTELCSRVPVLLRLHKSTLLEAEARGERSSGGGSPTTPTELRVYLVASEK